MIRCSQVYNIECLCCGRVYPEMVRIGAICMCPTCFVEEFGVAEIDPFSELGKKYYKWLEICKKEQGIGE